MAIRLARSRWELFWVPFTAAFVGQFLVGANAGAVTGVADPVPVRGALSVVAVCSALAVLGGQVLESDPTPVYLGSPEGEPESSGAPGDQFVEPTPLDSESSGRDRDRRFGRMSTTPARDEDPRPDRESPTAGDERRPERGDRERTRESN